MCKELDISVGTKVVKAFLQCGFYPETPTTKRMHKHNYDEIHIVVGGKIAFKIGEEDHIVEDGTLFAVPRGVYHFCVEKDETSVHTAFQIDYGVGNFISCKMNKGTIYDFLSEIGNSRKSGDYSKIAAYISLVCSYLCNKDFSGARKIADYGFLIREFFQTQYSKEVKLADLARVLNVSERQAERLVVEYIGRTFRDEVAFTRISIAKHLMSYTKMSLNDIATNVGYHSYAGFWKALKKYDNYTEKSVE